MSAGHIRIVEVSPRDGLQNEAAILTVEERLKLIGLLADAGLKEIEVGAFVRPDRVPQMAGSDAVVRSLPAREGVRTWSLVPNERCLEHAIQAGSKAVAFFTAASETFNRRNTGMGFEEQLAAFRKMADTARARALDFRVYLSTAFVCPYEGRIEPERVAEVLGPLAALNPLEVAISDTVGQATPEMIEEVLEASGPVLPRGHTALHLHDTNGRALENTEAGIRQGVRTFDAACGGTGGCPFAPGSAGNLATEKLVRFLEEEGFETGVSLSGLETAAGYLRKMLARNRE